jgi:hypothetical protein
MVSEVIPAAMAKEFQFGKKLKGILFKQVESENISL